MPGTSARHPNVIKPGRNRIAPVEFGLERNLKANGTVLPSAAKTTQAMLINERSASFLEKFRVS